MDNTLNPQFSKSVMVDYFFEELQKLKFFIYDIDSPSSNLKSADFLGELECSLGQVRIDYRNGMFTISVTESIKVSKNIFTSFL